MLSQDAINLLVLIIAVCLISGSFPLIMYKLIGVWRELIS